MTALEDSTLLPSAYAILQPLTVNDPYNLPLLIDKTLYSLLLPRRYRTYVLSDALIITYVRLIAIILQ